MSPRAAVELQARGVDAVDQRAYLPSSAADADVMATAWAEGCIIVARDYDMGELAIRRLAPAHGVIIVAFDAVSIEEEAERLSAEIGALGDRVKGCVTVIEAARVRIPRPIE